MRLMTAKEIENLDRTGQIPSLAGSDFNSANLTTAKQTAAGHSRLGRPNELQVRKRAQSGRRPRNGFALPA